MNFFMATVIGQCRTAYIMQMAYEGSATIVCMHAGQPVTAMHSPGIDQAQHTLRYSYVR